MNKLFHPFHLVTVSPWPLTSAISAMFMTLGLTEWFNLYSMNLMKLGMLTMIMSMIQWWRDVIRESTLQGCHSFKVTKNIKWGMIMFITSEVFFFISFFWAFFHSSLSPNIELGMNWPPQGIIAFNQFNVPLLNTIILLSSGVTITWAHHALLNNNFSKTSQGLILTIMLGIYFSFLQKMEYVESQFCIADSIYGSSFFMATGFHGIHVLIGTSFIAIITLRNSMFHFSKNHHFGFEAAAWYWHFVDVVWLFLFLSIYWWGS